MGLENPTYISDFVLTNPVGGVDPKSEGDDHIRNIKSALQNTFPNANGACNPTPAEFNALVGVATAMAAINSNTTLVIADFEYLPQISNITATATVTLPAASGVASGKRRVLKSSTTADVLIAPNGADTIEGVNANYRIPSYASFELISDGTSAWVLVRSTDMDVGDWKMSGKASAGIGELICDGAAISRTTYAGLFAVLSTTYGTGDGSTTFNVPDMKGRMLMGAGSGEFASTFTVDTSLDELTVDANDHLYQGQLVQVSSTTTLPSPLLGATNYYIINISSTKVKLATTRNNAEAGTAIDITDTGTGTHTLTLSLTTRSRGDIGGEEDHMQTEAEVNKHGHVLTDPGHTHTINSYSSGGNFDRVSSVGAGSDGTSDPEATSNSTTGISLAETGSNTPINNLPPYATSNFFIKT